MLAIAYSPELNIYTVHNGTREWIITPRELEPGARYHACADIFHQAKDAVESGRAVHGVCVEL